MHSKKAMKLGDMLQQTDALTYVNALKVTQTEIKSEVVEMAKMTENLLAAQERIEKLVRRADNQYRLIVKLAVYQNPVVTTVTIEADDTIRELMEDV